MDVKNLIFVLIALVVIVTLLMYCIYLYYELKKYKIKKFTKYVLKIEGKKDDIESFAAHIGISQKGFIRKNISKIF